MVLAIEPGCYWEGGGGLRVEDNFLITARRAPRSSRRFPDGVRAMPELTLIWTGALNDALRDRRAASASTTRRCATASRRSASCSTPTQKLEIARLLDELGVDRIEAGFPRVSDDDWQAVEQIAAAGLRAEIWGFSRAVPADLEALVELGVRYSVIESPISDLKLDAIGVSREKMLDRITSAMRFAAEHGIHAAFFGVDSTRAERDFYDRVYAAAVEAGAKEVVVVDTLGIASPEAVAELVGHTVELVDVPGALPRPQRLRRRDRERGRGGARGRDVRARDDQRHGRARRQREPRRGRADAARALRRRVEPAARPHPRRVGARARAVRLRARAVEAGHRRDALPARESGAVASQFHDPPSIEPYSSELVATERSIVLGKKSGLDSIRIKAEELGLDVPEERRAEVLAAVKTARRRRSGGSSPTTSSGASLAELRRDRRRQRGQRPRVRRAAREGRLERLRARAERLVRRRDQDRRDHRAGLPARRLQRVASALGRRRRRTRSSATSSRATASST